MNSRIACGCVAALLSWSVLVSTGPAQEANQDAANGKARQRKEKLSRGGTWVGRIVALEKDDVSFTLEVPIEIPYWEVRPVSWDAGGRVTAIRRTTGVYRETHRLEVWLPEEVKVRLPVRPDRDEKGRPLPTSRKADPSDPDRKLGGIPGAVEDLRKNQVVQVRLEHDRAKHWFAKTIIVLSERASP